MSGAVLDFKVDHECSSLAMLFMQFSSFAYSASVTISKYTQPVGLGREGSESRPEFQPQTGNVSSLEGRDCRVRLSEGPACRVRCPPLDHPSHVSGHDERACPSGHDRHASPTVPPTRRSIESPLTIG